MTNTDYIPKPGSVPARVLAFFTDNPEEELTPDEIAIKFDAVRNSIHTLLAATVGAGLLVRDRNDEGAYIYRLGHFTVQPAQEPAPKEPTKPAKQAARGYASPRKDIDLTALTVDDSVPFMAIGAQGQSKWQPLFDKLTKPGLSIALPGNVRGAVGAAAAKMNGEKKHGTYRVAMVDADTCRIWRIA